MFDGVWIVEFVDTVKRVLKHSVLKLLLKRPETYWPSHVQTNPQKTEVHERGVPIKPEEMSYHQSRISLKNIPPSKRGLNS